VAIHTAEHVGVVTATTTAHRSPRCRHARGGRFTPCPLDGCRRCSAVSRWSRDRSSLESQLHRKQRTIRPTTTATRSLMDSVMCVLHW